ncbi:MAG TPA: MerR family transcriptional regulator [Deltaproteobacteria bacterium]|nr:MerR family transcriptional regulator [Deltaproteobacteria bacterium]
MSKRAVSGKRGGGPAGGEDELTRDREALRALQASDKLYYRIGEVSRLTGVKAHVLRYWETEFRWMAPPKSRARQRLYRRQDIEFVLLLKRLLWDERYTIAGARQRIQELGVQNALAQLREAVEPASSGEATDSDAAVGDPSARHADWTSFRAALDEMQRDLSALRGVLQEGT